MPRWVCARASDLLPQAAPGAGPAPAPSLFRGTAPCRGRASLRAGSPVSAVLGLALLTPLAAAERHHQHTCKRRQRDIAEAEAGAGIGDPFHGHRYGRLVVRERPLADLAVEILRQPLEALPAAGAADLGQRGGELIVAGEGARHGLP